MSGVDQTFSLWISFVVTRWVTLLRTWLTRSSWLQYSGATQVQLESEVGRTITPDTNTGLTQDQTNKPISCRALGLFPPQASLASLKVAAAAKLVVARQDVVTKSRKVVLKMEGTMVVTSAPPLCWGFTSQR